MASWEQLEGHPSHLHYYLVVAILEALVLVLLLALRILEV